MLNIDVMSIDPKLFINGKSRFQTKFGMLMTIISFASIISIAAFFINQFLNGSSGMNVLFYSLDSDSIVTEWNLIGIPFMFNVHYVDGSPVKNPRMLNIVATY